MANNTNPVTMLENDDERFTQAIADFEAQQMAEYPEWMYAL